MKRVCPVCHHHIEDGDLANCSHCGTAHAFASTWQEIPSVTPTFPPSLFEQSIVSVAELELYQPEERDYLTIGGGIGSFCWVDHLRVSGIAAEHIAAIGFDAKPYSRWKALCENSQIPPHERIRSDSGSNPDNLWGWPGYAMRENWEDLRAGRITDAARRLWQIFAEPVAAQTYTPRAEQVYRGMEREAERIGWAQIWRYGRVLSIRKTDDGRYAVAYSSSTDEHPADYHVMLARYLHVAVGYSGIRMLPDLKAYRDQTGDFHHVVNAYEDHEHIYETLRLRGGTVLIRGRGIVASRIIQRLDEIRQANPHVAILHLLRSPRAQANHYEHAQRLVENQFEIQPFNFPRAAFGGDLKQRFMQGDPQTRVDYVNTWGGVTTADRHDWRNIVQCGLDEGWYQVRFGHVDRVESKEGRLLITMHTHGPLREQSRLAADFIIDATGLNAELRVNPLLRDLMQAYDLDCTPLGGILTSPDFEVEAMRNGQGRFYMSGVITRGGSYAPVDSFFGLQYAASRSVDDLRRSGAEGLKAIRGVYSAKQWFHWALGAQP